MGFAVTCWSTHKVL